MSLSVDLTPMERRGYVRGITRQVTSELSAITFPSAARSITLTARHGSVPITIVSRLAYPVRAVLVVATESLDVPSGKRESIRIAASRTTTSQVIVRAPTSGSFPAQLLLETPTGLVLDSSKVTVRSTAVTGIGSLLSVGALGFLGLWWGRHARQRRSERLIPR